MPWIEPGEYDYTGYSPVSVQIPYFYRSVQNTGFIETFVGGYCLGHVLNIGPSFFAGLELRNIWGTYTTELPVSLTGVRCRIGRTGAVSSGNLTVAVWHSNFDVAESTPVDALDYGLADFTTLTPDAVGSVPLASLPLADPLYNNTCATPAVSQTEITLTTPVVFDAATPLGTNGVQYTYWQGFVAFYLDDGFTAHSNLVVNAAAHSTAASDWVSNNLNFSRSATTTQGSPEWWEGPGCLNSGPPFYNLAITMDGVDLLLDPVIATASRRSRTWTAVIG